ncbi:MAG: polymer-forming cytoskeletal protein [Chloroflexi bacterium]|nr:polymer-forming cytoskeletal protein [Chloroflexota bacterium]
MFRRGSSFEVNAHADDAGETIINRDTSFQGTVKSGSGIRIYGTFEGEIETTGTLIIGKSAQVVAAINAHDIGVAGTVRGNLSAKGRVEMFAGGKVYGDIEAASLRIEEGALFVGQSLMKDRSSQPYLIEAPDVDAQAGEGPDSQ